MSERNYVKSLQEGNEKLHMMLYGKIIRMRLNNV